MSVETIELYPKIGSRVILCATSPWKWQQQGVGKIVNLVHGREWCQVIWQDGTAYNYPISNDLFSSTLIIVEPWAEPHLIEIEFLYSELNTLVRTLTSDDLKQVYYVFEGLVSSDAPRLGFLSRVLTIVSQLPVHLMLQVARLLNIKISSELWEAYCDKVTKG